MAGAYLYSSIQRDFTPVVMVLSTEKAEAMCQKSGLSFVDLLRPYSSLQQINGKLHCLHVCTLGLGVLSNQGGHHFERFVVHFIVNKRRGCTRLFAEDPQRDAAPDISGLNMTRSQGPLYI